MSFLIYPATSTGVAIYIKGDLFPKMGKIMDKINSILNECFNTNVNNTNVNNTIVFYFDTEKKIYRDKLLKKNIESVFKIVNSNVNNIKAVLTFKNYDNHIEIYDVCTQEPYRRQGLNSALLQNVIENSSKTYFWLGVKWLFNPFRDIALNLYLKNGFRVSNLTNQTFSKNPIGFTVVGMLYNRNTNKKIIPIYQALNYLNDFKCNLELVLDWNEVIALQNNLIGKNSEFAGIMKLTKYGAKKYFISPNRDSIVAGGEFEVNSPKAHINWHTHPYICYLKTNCYIGWPSGKDMQYIFLSYYNYGLLGHFLFTIEGLYFIQLTEEMMKFIQIISINGEWLKDLSELILFRFSYLQKYREIDTRMNCIDQTCLFYNNENREKNLKEFLERTKYSILQYLIDKSDEKYILKYADSIKFPIIHINENVKKCITYYEKFTNSSANFPIFNVLFINAENKEEFIKINLSAILDPQYGYCPN